MQFWREGGYSACWDAAWICWDDCTAAIAIDTGVVVGWYGTCKINTEINLFLFTARAKVYNYSQNLVSY